MDRILQEQTEKSLIDYQSRLDRAENDIAETACEQGAMDAKFVYTSKTIANLKDESVKLKSIIDVLEKDRSEMHVCSSVSSSQRMMYLKMCFLFLESVGY